jgi:hypothetical protein
VTTSTITVVHCDFPGCDAQAEQFDDRTMPAGWTSRIHTHGCPEHGEAIAGHAATVESWTARRKDWWSLRCACGWMPRPGVAAYTSRGLKAQHLAHLKAELGLPAT